MRSAGVPPKRTQRKGRIVVYYKDFDAIVELLRDVGASWTPNLARPPLPAQPPQNEHPYTPVSATATSGDANAVLITVVC